jgi:autotransporter-associated beta strand protein
LPDLADVNVGAGATFDLNNISDVIDALTGAGAVTLGAGTANTLTVGRNSGNGTFSGAISGTGNLVKMGVGTLVLSGNNTYSGTTSFNGGVVSTSSTNNLGAGQLNFDGGTWAATASLTNSRTIFIGDGDLGTIDVGTSATLGQFGPIQATGATLNKTGAGTLLLAAAASPLNMNINGGTLQSSTNGTLAPTTNVTVANSATWLLQGGADDAVATIAGSGAIRLDSGAELTVGADAGQTTFSGVISASGVLIKDGDHKLTLSGANTYSGGTRINGGTLAISSDANLGNPLTTVTIDGGTLETTASMTIDRSFVINAGGGVFATTGSLTVTTLPRNIAGTGSLTKTGAAFSGLVLSGNNSYSGGTVVDAGALTIESNANLGANTGAVTLVNGSRLNIVGTFTNQHAVILDNGGDISIGNGVTLTQAVGVSGAGTLVKNGAGTLLLTAPATHAGNTLINAGTLQFGSGELPDAFDVTVNGSAVWDLNGASDAIDGLFGNGTVLLGGGALTVGSAGGDGDFSGRILEAGAVIKTGNGTQILSGNNFYTVSTTISRGTLEVAGDSSLGDASATLIFDIATLRTNSTFATARPTTINALGSFDVASGTTLTFNSPINGAGVLGKLGGGALVLTQSNGYSGDTAIGEGTLRLAGAGQLADASDVDVAPGATFDMTDVSDAIDSLTGAGNVLLGTGTLTIGSAGGGGAFSGVISGAGLGGTIVKTGAGTAIFSGANAYAGGTQINGGVLQISQDANLGAAGGQVSFDGGALRTTANITTVREMSVAAAGGTIDVTSGTTLDAGGNIAGAGALTKIGAGTLQLGGISSYSGTNILSGVLSASFNFNLGDAAEPLNIDGGTLRTTNIFTSTRLTTIGAGGATFDVDDLTTHTHNGVIQGNGGGSGFVKTGAGAMRLGGVNTFIAPLHLNAGALEVDQSNQLGDVANVIGFGGGTLAALGSLANPRAMQLNAGGGTINVAAGQTLTQAGAIGDGPAGPAGSLTKAGAGTLLLTAANTFTSGVNIQGGVLRLSGDGMLPDTSDVNVTMPAAFDLNGASGAIDALSGDGDVLLGAGALTVGANDGGATFSGVISGDGGLVKVGAGTQLLRTKMVGMEVFPSTYTGGTVINRGVLDVETDNNLGDPAGALSFDGGTLQASGDNAINTSRTVTLNAGGGTVGAVGQDASVTLGGVISGSGGLTKTGVGSLTLSAANTYTGDTEIEGGVIRLQGAGRLPDASTVFVNVATTGGGAIPQGLQLNNINDVINGLNGDGEVQLGSGKLTVGAAGGGGDFSGMIEGTGALVKTGAGVQILSGDNTYSGGTSVNGGVLEIAANDNLGDAAGPLAFDGGALRTTGSMTIVRTTTLNPGGGDFDVAAGTTLAHAAQIGGAGGLTKTGAGDMTISAVAVYGGETTVDDGALRIIGVERLPNSTSVAVNAPGVLDLSNNNETIDGLSGSGNVLLGAAQLTVGIDGGDGAFRGVISGAGDFQKEGVGMQTLTGQHTYSGATVVNGGELQLLDGGTIDQTTLSVGFNNGSDGTVAVAGASTTWNLSGNLRVGVGGAGRLNINDGAVVTVGGEATIGTPAGAGVLTLDGGTLDNAVGTGILVLNGQLGGKGTVVGNIINQDTVAPGTSPGILDITGTYVQETTGAFVAEIGGASAGQFDVLAVTGTASLAGNLELGLAGFTPAPTDAFEILTAGALVGVFANAPNGARLEVTSGGFGSFQVNYGAASPFNSNRVVLSDFLGAGAVLPGDFNGDGFVDGADLAQWQGDFGLNADSDADSDGDTDGADFLAWQRQLGSGLLALDAASAVPEPTCFALLIESLAAWLISTSRGRRNTPSDKPEKRHVRL